MRISNKARLLGGTIIAGLMSVSFVACGGDTQEATSSSQAPAVSGPQLGSVAKGEVDVESLFSFLPEEIKVAYADTAYDQASGMTTLSDLKVTLAEDDDKGVSIEKLMIAGFDEDFLRARIAGTNFDQRAVIFDHFEAQNLSLFGLEQFYEDLTDVYLDAVDELAEEAIGENIPDIEQSIEKLEYVIERIAIDDLEFLPFELFSANEEAGGGQAALQLISTYYRAIGAKDVSMTGASVAMEMTQDGQAFSIDMKIPKTGFKGWRGGDIDLSYAEGITFDMEVPFPEDDDVPFESMDMSGGLAYYSVENFRLDKAFRWLARGEMPPTTETDLMSLGIWTMKDTSFTMFGAPFYSIDSYIIDLSNFHWLVPNDAEIKIENLVYDIGAFVDVIIELLPEDVPDREEIDMVSTSLDVLKDYDLSAISLDLSLDWDWNPETGVTKMSYFSGLDGYGTANFDLIGAMANFEQWAEAVQNADENGEEDPGDFEEFFADTFRLDGMRFEMDDRGGNDRLYDAVIALSKVLKDVHPSWEVASAYDKDTLKLLLSSTIKGAAGSMASEFPPITGYADALAKYLSDGGKFSVELVPDTPITADALEGLEGRVEGPEDIEAVLDDLGFSIRHTPG